MKVDKNFCEMSDCLGLNVWSLFSGIGGLELGLENAGLGHTTLQCEIDPFARKILQKHWPNVFLMKNVEDITSNPKGNPMLSWVDNPDIICGGFPCQPHSVAGKRKGKYDERHLWPEFARIIKEFEPTIVVGENVPGIRTSGGLEEVLIDLANLGYDAEWIRIGAAAVGAPHLRERIFIVAYARGAGRSENAQGTSGDEKANGRKSNKNNIVDSNAQSDTRGIDPRTTQVYSNADSQRLKDESKSDGRKKSRSWKTSGELRDHIDRLCAGLGDSEPLIFTEKQREKLPISPAETGWAREPDVGRLAYGVSNRVDQLRVLGNAVVPQVAEFVGRCIYDAIL